MVDLAWRMVWRDCGCYFMVGIHTQTQHNPCLSKQECDKEGFFCLSIMFCASAACSCAEQKLSYSYQGDVSSRPCLYQPTN